MYKNMPMPKPFSAEIVYFCNMSIVRAKKSLGQHFLRDQNIARKITDSLLPVTRDILEIGPGMGVLTRHLFANPAFSVRAIDIDQESIDKPAFGPSGGLYDTKRSGRTDCSLSG